jgi:hypothetical protein
MRSPVGSFRARRWRCLSKAIDQETFAHKHTELRNRLASIKLQLDAVDRSQDERQSWRREFLNFRKRYGSNGLPPTTP